MRLLFCNIRFIGGRKGKKERILVRDNRFMWPRRRGEGGGSGPGCSDEAGSLTGGVANLGETEQFGLLPKCNGRIRTSLEQAEFLSS
jgi:hypothetical protein